MRIIHSNTPTLNPIHYPQSWEGGGGSSVDFPCIFSESQRDSVPQPRVARTRYPGKESHRMINPNGVVSSCFNLTPNPTLLVRPIPFPICFNNPRRSLGHNPFRVAVLYRSLPRVARCAQPWAMGQNPVGVLKGKALAPPMTPSQLCG